MGILSSYIDRRLGSELRTRRVLVWYDPPRQWQPWITAILRDGAQLDETQRATVMLGGHHASLVNFAGSYYETRKAGENAMAIAPDIPLVIYVHGEPHIETLSPLRELECFGGDKEPFHRDLAQVARSAFQGAGLSDARIDDLLNRDGLTFQYLDAVSIEGGGEASPLAPVFGSSREIDVFPIFLVEPQRRQEIASHGLLGELRALAKKGLGLPLKSAIDGEEMARELARLLLVAELRSDLRGPEPRAISQIPKPSSAEQVQRIRQICNRLRLEWPDTYEKLADTVEQEFALAAANIDAKALGSIDTFRFEERRLLEACDQLLSAGEANEVLTIVEQRSTSFWTSISRFPQRQADWRACAELARLLAATDRVRAAIRTGPPTPCEWIERYAASDGWWMMDRAHRVAQRALAALEDDSVVEQGRSKALARYESIIDEMASACSRTFAAANWEMSGITPQTQTFDRRVERAPKPVAYFLIDAMRYEMGSELAGLMESVGAGEIMLEPTLAALPTVTDVGMVALLPGAERSFSILPVNKAVSGAIEGKALLGSQARMDHARAAKPGLIEMTMDRLFEMSQKKLEEEIQGAPIVIIRSQEIDSAGEALSNWMARSVMGSVLERARKAVLRLTECGVSRFVVAADHGHLFGEPRGDDMKIDPPDGGQTVALHRRCWIGRGGSTPTGCVRVAARDLGYASDLELVFPKGAAVFKSGGDLAYHHGGASLQELIVPVLSFRLESRKPAKRKKGGDPIRLEGLQSEISNRIFSVRIVPAQLGLLEPLRMRVLAVSDEDGATVGQAMFATAGWDQERREVVLEAGNAVDVGIQLDDDEVEILRVVVVEVGTDRTLKDSAPIPVRLLR